MHECSAFGARSICVVHASVYYNCGDKALINRNVTWSIFCQRIMQFSPYNALMTSYSKTNPRIDFCKLQLQTFVTNIYLVYHCYFLVCRSCTYLLIVLVPVLNY